MEAEFLRTAFHSISINDFDIQELQERGERGELDFTGEAQFEMKSGCSYEGEIKDGKLHGMGKLTFPDKMEYEGSFVMNEITGKGTYRWPCGTVYTGDVVRGKRHGKGCMSFSDSPAVYDGQWLNGMRHGQGMLTLDAEGKHKYKGDWKKDKKSGVGIMTYANGNQYDGEWEQDVKCGYGTMEWKSMNQRYEGQWAHNKPNGMGNHVWYQQLVKEPSKANHALLIQFNRYNGQFFDGLRNGYGVLHYATGARYEGCWLNDKKEGEGCYVFENGEVWQGMFSEDRPLLTDRDAFGPTEQTVSVQLNDLFDEEEVPAAAARGVYNLLMVYNTDLRALYDKYCSRPSLHFMKGFSRPSFTLVICQVWELLSDVRMLSAATPIARCNDMFSMARRPPEKLEVFRKRMHATLAQPSDDYNTQFWMEIMNEHKQGGVHNPMAELLYPQFCEALVRLAALRYRHLPGLEKRLHTLIQVHLLHQVSKNKTPLPPPPRLPYHMELWAGNAMVVLESQQYLLHQIWGVLAESVAANAAANASGNPRPLKEQPPKRYSRHISRLQEQLLDLEGIYGPVYRVRDFMALLQGLNLLPTPQLAMQAAAALTSNYLTINTYEASETSQKLRIEDSPDQEAKTEAVPGSPETAQGSGSLGPDGSPSKGLKRSESREKREGAEGQQKVSPAASKAGSKAGSKAVSKAGSWGAEKKEKSEQDNAAYQQLSDADVREVLCWLDAPLTYCDFLEGLAKVANALYAFSHDNLKDRLTEFLTGTDGLQVALKINTKRMTMKASATGVIATSTFQTCSPIR